MKFFKYYKELKKQGLELCEGTGFEFALKLNLNFAPNAPSGETENNIEPPESGKRKMSVYYGKPFFTLRSTDAFVECLVNMFHEHTHVEQYLDCKNGKAKDDLLYDFLSKQDNSKDFYGNNYSHQLFEIDAERNGVKRAYDYLKDNHSELDAFKYIKRYIDRAIEKKDKRYINKGFENCETIEDVEKKFNEYYKTNKKESCYLDEIYRAYTYDDYRGQEKGDIIYKMIDELGLEDFRNIMMILREGDSQKKFIDAFILEKHPEYHSFFSKKIQLLDVEQYVSAYHEMKDRGEILIGSPSSSKVYNSKIEELKEHSDVEEEYER